MTKETLRTLDAIKYQIETMMGILDTNWDEGDMRTLALGQISGLRFALAMIEIAEKDTEDLIKRTETMKAAMETEAIKRAIGNE